MSFYASTEDNSVRVESRGNRSILHARCQKINGEYVDSELDLDNYLGNHNGVFTLILQSLSPLQNVKS
jgi:CVNH domain